MASTQVADRLLWTAVIVSSIAACWYVPTFLHHVKDLATVKDSKPKIPEPQLKQDAEASIKPSTLAELACGPNYNLTSSAIRLTTARFIKNAPAKKELLRDLAHKDWHRRGRAINALRVLLSSPALKESNTRQHFLDQATYSAFVSALVNLLPDHEDDTKSTTLPTSPVRPRSRPAQEQAILELLLMLLEEPRQHGTNSFYIVDAQPAINAGIITKWLKHYPFPCSLPQYRRHNFKKNDVCRLMEPEIWGQDDSHMSKLIMILLKLPSGLRQFAEIGLRPPAYHIRPQSREWATHFFQPLSTGSQDRPSWNNGEGGDDFDDEEGGQFIEEADLLTRLQDTQRRSQFGRTPGERSRQRRNRQAVVVAEPGEPLRPENILQRQPTETEIAWQQGIQDRQGQILHGVSSRSLSGVEDATGQLARERIDGLGEHGDGFNPVQLPDLDDLPSADT